MKHRIFTLMLAVVAVLSFTSCQRQDPDTTYTINFHKDVSLLETAQKYNATLKEVVLVKEYNRKGEGVKTQFADLTGGGKKTFLASPLAEKITIRVDRESKMYGETVIDTKQWLQAVTYLRGGKDTMVEIEWETIIGDYEPNVQ